MQIKGQIAPPKCKVKVHFRHVCAHKVHVYTHVQLSKAVYTLYI